MELKLTNPFICFRNITTDDEETLFQIYASTRTEELIHLTNWTSGQKEAFLRLQFSAQHSHYQNNYEGAHFWVIEYKSQIIGRLYLHTLYESTSMRIIDITLLPEWRNKGIGNQILLDVLEWAESKNRSVTIHVESFNRAMNLYKKLGFVLASQTNGVYHLLEWKSNNHAFQENLSLKQAATNGNRTSAFSSL